MHESESTDTNYVLATGYSGARRLVFLEAVYGPASRSLLQRTGIGPAQRVLDLGCGLGEMTFWLAERVGPVGQAIGVDSSTAQLALARQRTGSVGLNQLSFRQANVHATGLPRATFDLVYARFLLSHVNRPFEALREIVGLLRPGGMFVCEDLDASATYTVPRSDAYERSISLMIALADRQGGEFERGRSLHRLLAEAGLEVLETSAWQPTLMNGEGKRVWSWTLGEATGSLIDTGLASRDELDMLARAMDAFDADPTTMVGLPRVHQLISLKPRA
jgi:ubiquinone/menaquinone biosynthesis C-methylase UbiE